MDTSQNSNRPYLDRSRPENPFASSKREREVEVLAYYISNRDEGFRDGHIGYVEWPDEFKPVQAQEVARPAFPEVTRNSLAALQPCVMFVQYQCTPKCRSLGICIHYQFVIGGRCPDGLICERCSVDGAEQVCPNVPVSAVTQRLMATATNSSDTTIMSLTQPIYQSAKLLW